jgi:hypothetical protein
MLTKKAVIIPTRAPSHQPIAPPTLAPSKLRSLDMLYRGEVGSVPPNGPRLSCGALVKESSFNILRAPSASSAC